MQLKMPTLWTEGEGRSTPALITETAGVIFRGSRGGMWRRISSPVLETLHGDEIRPSTEVYKETKSQQAMKGVGGVHSTV